MDFYYCIVQSVKAGLALALFGGCQKYVDDKNRIPIRGDPHMLIVGDPGLGKSQMLQVHLRVKTRRIWWEVVFINV